MDDFAVCSTSRVYSIAGLRSIVISGQFRVPQFQRLSRWEAQDVLNLFDFTLRGYPFESLPLWQREADADDLRAGTLEARAGAHPNALWVVDGQQRITDLINVVDPKGTTDRRFAIGYPPRARKVVLTDRHEESLVVPLPDLFGFGRAPEWLRKNPDASIYVEFIQDVVGRFNRLAVLAIVLEQTDENILREIFNRIGSRGERPNSTKVFGAIYGGPDRGLTTSGIAAHVNEQACFGRLDDKAVVQALFVRRCLDITRDLHDEPSPSR